MGQGRIPTVEEAQDHKFAPRIKQISELIIERENGRAMYTEKDPVLMFDRLLKQGLIPDRDEVQYGFGCRRLLQGAKDFNLDSDRTITQHQNPDPKRLCKFCNSNSPFLEIPPDIFSMFYFASLPKDAIEMCNNLLSDECPDRIIWIPVSEGRFYEDWELWNIQHTAYRSLLEYGLVVMFDKTRNYRYVAYPAIH